MNAAPLVTRRLLSNSRLSRRDCIEAVWKGRRHHLPTRGGTAAAPVAGAWLAHVARGCVTATGTGRGGARTSSGWFVGAIAAASLVVANESSRARQNGKGTATGCESTADLPPNPLWPSGVPQEMVDRFVDEILADPSINIAAIPDSIEREIYKNTVLLTLNCVYESVGGFHGMEMFGHAIELHRVDEEEVEEEEERRRQSADGPEKTMKRRVRRAYSRTDSIDHAALEAVADRLLANKAVNQPLIPDVVERQLYVNCLKLVFRLLDAVASTLRVTLCGHDVRLVFKPCSDQSTRRWIQERLQKRAGEASSSLTEVDLAAVEKYARQVGAAPEDPGQMSWLGKILNRGQREMEVQLNKTLYALILGIMDDLLEDTVLTFLTDRIRMDVVARRKEEDVGTSSNGPGEGANASTRGGGKNDEVPEKNEDAKPAAAVPIVGASFSMGIFVGAALMSALSAAGRK